MKRTNGFAEAVELNDQGFIVGLLFWGMKQRVKAVRERTGLWKTDDILGWVRFSCRIHELRGRTLGEGEGRSRQKRVELVVQAQRPYNLTTECTEFELCPHIQARVPMWSPMQSPDRTTFHRDVRVATLNMVGRRFLAPD